VTPEQPEAIALQAIRAAKAIAASDSVSLSGVLNEQMERFLSPHFLVRSGRVSDGKGNESPSFSTIVYRAGEALADSDAIPADRAAVVVDICDDLTPAALIDAYARLSSVRRMQKDAIPSQEVRTNITLTIVLGRRSSGSLERLADQLFSLNEMRPHAEWLDMVAITDVGAISYAVQFPGEGLSGDYLPPANGALGPNPPAFYIVVVIRPTLELTFSKMLTFVISHLVVFAPDIAASLPSWSLLLESVPKEVVTHFGFQPNLIGEIVPVPPDGYAGRMAPALPATIEDGRGCLLSTIEYREWQDGGIILATGKLPLEGLLLFLPAVRPEYLKVIKRQHVQVSHVLPLTQQLFASFLQNIQRRSNMKVNTQPAQGFVIQKIMDEGTTTPFVARCYLGLIKLRENAIPDRPKQETFDRIFQSSLSSLMSARTASQEIKRLWEDHASRVQSGEIAKIEGPYIKVSESVDRSLATEFENFLNAGVRTMKTGVQGIATQLGADIGFLFKKQNAFEKGTEKLQQTDPELAEYLRESRTWSERLVGLRNDLEHDFWQFPRVTYANVGGTVVAAEPKVSGEQVTGLLEIFLDRLCCFFEEIIAHVLRKQLLAGMTLTELPTGTRPAEAPERFRITLANGGEAPWRIQYHAEKFEDV
jgi:hypothetical protein